MAKFRNYCAEIESAIVESVKIEAFVEDGGPSRENRPMAFVISRVRYNNRERASEFRTPWVLHKGVWYTRALGKVRF